MRLLLRPLVVFCLLSIGAAWPAAAADKVVLELFTSQGCSSCPSADALLKKYTGRGDFIVLSFHVDYWNYIGWKDTFATTETTGRQRAYGHSLRQKYVYTPEMVIGGAHHTTGSDQRSIEHHVDLVRGAVMPHVSVGIDGQGSALLARISGGSGLRGEIWLFEIDRSHTVEINKGENTGRSLSYYHVVRRIHALGQWRGGEHVINLSSATTGAEGRDGLVVLVQRPNQGPVLGAAQIWLN